MINCMLDIRIKHFIRKYCVVQEPGDDSFHVITMNGCYITLKELVDKGSYGILKMLVEHKITKVQNCMNDLPGSVANIGFSESEQKWYGWSHRAYFGFGVGSTCKAGNLHYQPANLADFVQNQINFWTDLDFYEVQPMLDEENSTDELIVLKYKYNDDVPNSELKGKWDSRSVAIPKTFGKGEWTAETLEDAKQMAIDFAMAIN